MNRFFRFALIVICLMAPYAASAQVLYSETFDASLGTTTPSGADGSADWQFRNNCGANALGGHSGTGTARWGNPGSCGDFGGNGDTDELTSSVIDTTGCDQIEIRFNYFMEYQEDCTWDRARIQISVNGGGFTTIGSNGCGQGGLNLTQNSGVWQSFSDIQNAGTNLQVRLIGETADGLFNSGQGFFGDDLEVECLGVEDVSSLSAPDVPNEGGGALVTFPSRDEEPAGVTLDGTVPQLLVTSRDNSLIPLFDSSAGSFLDFFVSPTLGGLEQPQGLGFGPDGHLYVASYETDSILRYDGTDGAFIDAFVSPTAGGLDGPVEFVWGADGNLYVASFVNDSVLRYNGSDGSFIDAFVTPTLGGLDGPEGLAFGPDGQLYVTSSETDAVLRYDGSTGAFVDAFVTPTLGGLDGPVSLSWGPDGDLYVSSFISDSIIRYSGSDGSFIDIFVTSTLGGLDGPVGQAWGPDGNLYVASFHNHAVARYDGETGAPLGQFVTSTLGALDGPRGIIFTNSSGSTTGGTTAGGETTGGSTGVDAGSGGCSLVR